MGPQVLVPAGVGLVLEDVRLVDGAVHLSACCAAAAAPCSACGRLSSRIHSSYERHTVYFTERGHRHLFVLEVVGGALASADRQLPCAEIG